MPRPVGRLEGRPVYDAAVVGQVRFEDGPRVEARVVVGIGPIDGYPAAYLALCPCEGVRGLVDDLQRVGAAAAEHHAHH